MTELPITVAISTFNRAHYLKLCLESVFASRELPAEVLVMNDGSTDATPETVAAFGERVKGFYQENQGLAAARNALVKRATQKYIIFLDDDDLLLPDAIPLLYQAVSASQGKPAAAYGQYRRIDSNGNGLPTKLKRKHFPSGMIAADLFLKNLILPSATLLDREYILAQGMTFPTGVRVGEDYPFMLELSRRIPFYAVNEPIVLRRRHQNNLSARSADGPVIEFNVLKNFYDNNPDVQTLIPRSIARKRLAELKIRTARNLTDPAARRQAFAEALKLKFSFKALWGKLFS